MFNVEDTGCHTGVNRLVRHWGCLPPSSVTLFTPKAPQKYVHLENRLHGGGILLIMIQLVCGEQAEWCKTWGAGPDKSADIGGGMQVSRCQAADVNRAPAAGRRFVMRM